MVTAAHSGKYGVDYTTQLAALRIILFIFIEHYRHRVMCQREDVGRSNVLVTSGDGSSTLSVGHIHGLSFTPPMGWERTGCPG